MMKFLIVLCVAVALIMPMHETQAFKVITIQKGVSTAPAFDPSPLIQGVQSSIASKIQQVSSLVGSLVQQKIAFKQNALNSIQGLAGSVKPSFVIRKSIYVGNAPEATTATDVGATTTTKN